MTSWKGGSVRKGYKGMQLQRPAGSQSPDTPRRYLNAVQTTAQHLLRYLAAAVVVNKRRRNLLKDLVKVPHSLGHKAVG